MVEPGDFTAPRVRLAFPLRYALGGLIASSILALGAVGVGWLPVNGPLDNPIVSLLKYPEAGVFFSRGAVIIGGALLLQAWLILGSDILSGHVRDVRRLWTVLAVWAAPLVLAPPLFSRDVYSYYAQGLLVLKGVDPYTHGVASVPGWMNNGVDPMWQDTPTPYGPLFLSLSRGVAALVGPDNPYLAALLFRLVGLLGVVLMAYYVPRLAFLCGIDPSKALWLGVLNPLVLMNFVSGIHNDALLVGLLVAGVCLVMERRPVLGVVLVTLACMVKPIGLLALPFVGILWAGTHQGLRQRVVAWLKTAGIAASTYAVLAVAIGASFGWIRALTTPGEVLTWLSPSTAIGLAISKALSLVGLGEHTDLTVGIVRGIAMAAAVVIVAWLILRPQGRTAVRSMVLAYVVVIFLGPVVQPWYLLWPLPLAAASGLRPKELRGVLLATAAFTLYGLCETSASADGYLELSDGLAMVAAAVAIGLAVWFYPRERALLFGGAVSFGLMPEDRPAQARHERLIVRPRSAT